MTSLHEVALLRLAAQRLAGPGSATAADALRWMTAVQAQDYNGALVSVALRTSAGTRPDVEAALDAGEVVRSWPMRGTLHLVAAEDLPWMLQLLTPRVVAGAAARRAGLNLDAAALERARALTVEALAGGRRLSRDDLLAVWDGAGVVTAGQRGYHLLWQLAQTGTLCFGPVRDGQQLIVLVDEWIPRPRHLDHDEALGELAWRYFRSRGPATVKDLMRWAHLVDPRTPELLESCRREARGVFLLPGFDELILGYQDRRCMVPAEFADRIVPGANGMFRATVISNGQVVGTWKHAGRVANPRLEVTPFHSFPAEVAEAIPRVYAELP